MKNRGEGKRMASSSGEWFLAIFPSYIYMRISTHLARISWMRMSTHLARILWMRMSTHLARILWMRMSTHLVHIVDAYEYASRSYIVDAYEYASRSYLVLWGIKRWDGTAVPFLPPPSSTPPQ